MFVWVRVARDTVCGAVFASEDWKLQQAHRDWGVVRVGIECLRPRVVVDLHPRRLK